jgi:hypothetical protein
MNYPEAAEIMLPSNLALTRVTGHALKLRGVLSPAAVTPEPSVIMHPRHFCHSYSSLIFCGQHYTSDLI